MSVDQFHHRLDEVEKRVRRIKNKSVVTLPVRAPVPIGLQVDVDKWLLTAYIGGVVSKTLTIWWPRYVSPQTSSTDFRFPTPHASSSLLNNLGRFAVQRWNPGGANGGRFHTAAIIGGSSTALSTFTIGGGSWTYNPSEVHSNTAYSSTSYLYYNYSGTHNNEITSFDFQQDDNGTRGAGLTWYGFNIPGAPFNDNLAVSLSWGTQWFFTTNYVSFTGDGGGNYLLSTAADGAAVSTSPAILASGLFSTIRLDAVYLGTSRITYSLGPTGLKW